jgi:hypothetical protein
MIDYILSNAEWVWMCTAQAFFMTGYSENRFAQMHELFMRGKAARRSKIRIHPVSSEHVRIILYAPTFRGRRASQDTGISRFNLATGSAVLLENVCRHWGRETGGLL